MKFHHEFSNFRPSLPSTCLSSLSVKFRHAAVWTDVDWQSSDEIYPDADVKDFSKFSESVDRHRNRIIGCRKSRASFRSLNIKISEEITGSEVNDFNFDDFETFWSRLMIQFIIGNAWGAYQPFHSYFCLDRWLLKWRHLFTLDRDVSSQTERQTRRKYLLIIEDFLNLITYSR